MSPRWLAVRRRLDAAAARLYCFPHSGGSVGEYLRWSDALLGIEVSGMKLPGRGARLDEPLITDLAELVTTVVDEVEFAPPFVLFGHSFGALVAYEVTHELWARGRDMPLHLVVSGYGPPDMPRPAPPMSELPDRQLLSSLGDFYGGVPAELTADPELAALVVPAYRADLRALENYRYSERPPVPCPLTVIGGDQDVYSAEQLARWRRHAGAAYRLTVLPGGHFYFRDRPEPLWRELRSVLAMPADGPGPTAAAAADAH